MDIHCICIFVFNLCTRRRWTGFSRRNPRTRPRQKESRVCNITTFRHRLAISLYPDSRVLGGARSDGEAPPVEAAVVAAGEGAALPHGHRLNVVPVPVVDRVPPLEHDLGHGLITYKSF